MRVLSNVSAKDIAALLTTKATPVDVNTASAFRKQAKIINALDGYFQMAKQLTQVERFLRAVDVDLNTHGVESFSVKVPGEGVKTCWYCNAGDTYNTTVLFFRGKVRLGCWGDIAEKYQDA